MAMRVAMVTDYPADENRIDGGVQAVASYLVPAIARSTDVSLEVVSFGRDVDRHEVRERHGFVHHRFPVGRLGLVTGFSTDRRRLNALMAETGTDLVHSQGVGHFGTLARRSGRPYVMTIHGIFSREAAFASGFRRQFRTRVQGWLDESFALRRAQHTILISPYVAEHYGDRLGGRHYLIPNPVHDRFFGVERREQPNRILFAGRLYALKGVAELLDAVARLPRPQDVLVELAGSLADEPYVGALRERAASLGIAGNVRFCGIVTASELLEKLSRAACLVLPSYQETAPMVIQEAMAAGVPVIASDVGGTRFQVDDGDTGFLVAPGDRTALADRLATVLGDAALRERFGRAARTKAGSHYRADAVARKTIDVYRGMLQ